MDENLRNKKINSTKNIIQEYVFVLLGAAIIAIGFNTLLFSKPSSFRWGKWD